MQHDKLLDTDMLRKDFPILSGESGGESIVYLDSAATSLTPVQVIKAVSEFHLTSVGVVNRSIHRLAREVTERYRRARRTIAWLIGAEEDEIVLVRNTTEAVNLVAAADARLRCRPVVTTLANHHSSLLPWSRNCTVRHARLNSDGTLCMDDLYSKLTSEVALVCVPHISNAMGLLMPVREIVQRARQIGALVMIDAAQSVPHMPVNVHDLDCDFLAFSGHKMLAPFGIGVLYGRRCHLDAMEPFLVGGDMVESVREDAYVCKTPPAKFEAGTPNVGGAIGLATAVDYLENIGMDRIHAHVRYLARLARQRLREIVGLQVYGPSSDDCVESAVSFGIGGIPAHTLASLLSERFGIMVRSGYHCAQPLHDSLGLPHTVRASFYLYNTEQEIEMLVAALSQLRDSFDVVGRMD